MEEWDERTYGARLAAEYDERAFGAPPDSETKDAVSFLANVLEGTPGRILELGSGTGRLLLPLAERGFCVQGIELSPEMVAQMRTKPGGDEVPVVVGDMASFEIQERFDVVLLANNTLFSVLGQERQVQCLQTAVDHLATGGVVVVECYAPYPLTKLPAKNVLTHSLSADEVVLIPTVHNEVEQTIDVNVVVLSEEGIRLFPWRVRYAWPPEIDLMARLAGLRLVERLAGWTGEQFGPGSDSHISVYAASSPG